METLPGLQLVGQFALGEDGWDDEMNANLRRISVLSQLTVTSFVAALPGSPTAGDRHILTAATGGGANHDIALRLASTWMFFTPQPGFRAWNLADDVVYAFHDGAWSASGGIEEAPEDGETYARKDGAWELIASGGGGLYRFGGFFTTTPAADEVLMLHAVTDDFTLPDDLDGCMVTVGTNPSATTVLSMEVNGAEVATISISNAGALTIATTGGAVDVETGDVVGLIAPAASNGLANVAFTFRGA